MLVRDLSEVHLVYHGLWSGVAGTGHVGALARRWHTPMRLAELARVLFMSPVPIAASLAL